MFRRALAAIAALMLAALAAVPADAVPLGRGAIGGVEKSPGKAATDSSPTTSIALQHAMPAKQGDKAALVVDTGTIALIRDEDGGILIGKLYMVFIERDVEEVAAIAGAPQLCAIPLCEGVPENAIAEAADRARESIMRQRESGVGNFSASKQVREKDTAYRFEEIKEPAGNNYGGGGEPVALMNAPRPPWWQDWVTPTTVIGLLGTIIAGFSAWYAVQHQRHQMQQEQLKLAVAASAPAAPLTAAPIAEVSSKPRRPRAASSSTGTSSAPPAAGSRRTRSNS